MMRIWAWGAAVLVLAIAAAGGSLAATAPDNGLGNLKHIIVIFQENRSFDHYFGVLPYAPGSPYHQARPCPAGDHACVDGLECKLSADGALSCADWNAHADGRRVYAFHAPTR